MDTQASKLAPIRDTVISENFVAIPVKDGYHFARHDYALWGLIKVSHAARRVKRAHRCLTRHGELYAADVDEAKAILATLEGAIDEISAA